MASQPASPPPAGSVRRPASPRRRFIIALLLAVNVGAFSYLAGNILLLTTPADGRAELTISGCRFSDACTLAVEVRGDFQPGEVISAVGWHIHHTNRTARFARDSFLVGPDAGPQMMTLHLPEAFAGPAMAQALRAVHSNWLGRPFQLAESRTETLFVVTNQSGDRYVSLLMLSRSAEPGEPVTEVSLACNPIQLHTASNHLALVEVFLDGRSPALVRLDFMVRHGSQLFQVPPLSAWALSDSNGVMNGCFTWKAPSPPPADRAIWSLRTFNMATRTDTLVVRAASRELEGLAWRTNAPLENVPLLDDMVREVSLLAARDPNRPSAEAFIRVQRMRVPPELRATHPQGGFFGGAPPSLVQPTGRMGGPLAP